MTMRERVSGVILAGGDSRRMGRNKAFLPWGGTTLIEHLIERLRPVTDELIVAVKDAQAFRHLKARVVEDCLPDAHALGGLYTALCQASHELCVVCACDTPFFSSAFMQLLIEQAAGWEAVIPQTSEGIQPLQAAYRTSAVPTIEQQLQQRQFDLHALVPKLHARIIEPTQWRRVDPSGLSFINLNTPQDYVNACLG